MLDIPPQISVIFFTVWLLFFITGHYQFKKIKLFTTTFVEENIQAAIEKNSKLFVNDYYEQIYNRWAEYISKKFMFIPHKSELFPVRTSPEYIVKRINFTPEWVGAYLQLKGYRLERTLEQGKRIDEILARVSKN